MVGRRHKSQELHANVKEEADNESHLKLADDSAHAAGRALCAVEVKEETDDDHSKPILDGCKMVHIQQTPVRRGIRSKYSKDSRYAYIMSIAHRMKLSPNSMVSSVEGRLFHNVFNHLVDAILSSQTVGSEDKAIEVNISSDGSPLVGRECLLKKILALLLCMARRRLYDPLSDSEVVYYREIKRHIRCVIAYHEAKRKPEDVQWAYSTDPAGYHSLSCSQTISAVEELIELTGSLAELIPQFQELSQNNVAVLAPDIALHVTMDFKSLPEPNWSVERTNAFYYNKLILALHDLKCSGLVGLSPKSKEKKSINSLLDYVTCTHLHVKKEYKLSDSLYASEPVCATSRKRGRGVQTDREDDENFYPLGQVMRTAELFDGRLIEYMKQLRKTCLRLMLDIMGKLEPVVYPVTLFPMDDNNTMLEWLKRVKFLRPRRSVNDIHEPVLLASYAASLIQGISSSVEDACAELTDMLRRRRHYHEFAPQALLVLLLLDCGAFRKAAAEKMATVPDGEAHNSNCSPSHQCKTDNVKILTTILRVLKDIRTSDAPSPGEVIIQDQIMEHVSLCIDGFLSTRAYQKERLELRRTPCRHVASELYRLSANGASDFLYCGSTFGAEDMSQRLRQLGEGFDLVIQALQKVEII